MSGNIYISRRSQPCQQLLMLIHQNKDIFDFNIIDIDTNPYPNIIKSIPVLIIDDQLINGSKLFQIIQNNIEMYNKKQNVNPQNSHYQNNDQHPQDIRNSNENNNNSNNENNLDISGFCLNGNCELGFSMLDDDNNNNIDNYEYLNDMEHTERKINNETKAQRQEELDKSYEKMMNYRN